MFIISLAVIALVTVIDQLLKFAVVQNIELGESIRVIHFGSFDVFDITHVTNKGAAWSMMSGRTWFLVGFPIAVILGGLVYMYFKRSGHKLQLISLALLIGGGIGNLIDRIRLGEVVDYIKFKPISFPVFNFADICVVIGVILLAVFFIFFDRSEKKTGSADAVTAAENDDTEIVEHEDEQT